MILPQHLCHYTLPVIAVDEKGFVAAKNYSAEMHIGMVHVGASVQKYTDIDFSAEQLSKGVFCGKEYTYFTVFHSYEDCKFTLLFLCLSSFGEMFAPFNVFELYKERIKSLPESSLQYKNKERQYVRATHNNMIKANYFAEFSEVFNTRFSRRTRTNNDTVVLSHICSAIEMATANYLDGIELSLNVDYTCGTLIANISEIDIATIFLNSLLFCVINSDSPISISLAEDNKVAKIAFTFTSNSSFDRWVDVTSCSGLNSSLAMCIAFKTAEIYGFEHNVTRVSKGKTSTNTLTYSIPVTVSSQIQFSSGSTVAETIKQLMLNIFFNELI